MKKLLYILALVSMLTASVSACTDENVQPRTNDSPVGNGADPK